MNKKVRTEKGFTCLFIVLASLCFYVTSYFLPALGILNTWVYNVYIIIFEFCLFLYLLFYKGFIGFKANLVKSSKQYAQQTTINNFSLLYHSIKNSLSTMNLQLNNIRFDLKHSNIDGYDPNDDIDSVLESCNHLQAMMTRIKIGLKPITVTKLPQHVSPIIFESINEILPLIVQKEIEYTVTTDDTIVLLCDRVHLKEAILNLLRNSIDALMPKGTLQVKAFVDRREFIIRVIDNGCGIPEKLQNRLLDPLFTTKTDGEHFGLGLFYVQQVMQHHQGIVNIQSTERKGTLIELKFLRRSVIEK